MITIFQIPYYNGIATQNTALHIELPAISLAKIQKQFKGILFIITDDPYKCVGVCREGVEGKRFWRDKVDCWVPFPESRIQPKVFHKLGIGPNNNHQILHILPLTLAVFSLKAIIKPQFTLLSPSTAGLTPILTTVQMWFSEQQKARSHTVRISCYSRSVCDCVSPTRTDVFSSFDQEWEQR